MDARHPVVHGGSQQTLKQRDGSIQFSFVLIQRSQMIQRSRNLQVDPGPNKTLDNLEMPRYEVAFGRLRQAAEPKRCGFRLQESSEPRVVRLSGGSSNLKSTGNKRLCFQRTAEVKVDTGKAVQIRRKVRIAGTK